MKTQKITQLAAQSFIALSAVSLLSVSVMAFLNPQSVMDLVGVKLPNTDAFSSIRGVYGGVGLTLFISLIYLMRRDLLKGLAFLGLLWGFYAVSRVVTVFTEGPLGDFGQQWLLIETLFFVIAISLILAVKKSTNPQTSIQYGTSK
ncbi:DUF4345 domain-containing protein [Adhaeribacter swui]|uniref:DUF4345 domain-containing protein n=1 Tax=Adhaeribacter swui TaxID=2086471 RepID=A0A7G7GC39_9BACT|nr:DUF4345 domain-containing protein [Adhaeribacter swui]QNF34723.1 DUF4345 domain-containing protein [Adhaeribacter swui]